MTRLNDRGENYQKLLHRLVSVVLLPDGSQPGQAVANLKRAAELKLMAGFYEQAAEQARGMIQMLRFSKEGEYRESSDEEICKLIMQAIEERDRARRGTKD